MTRVKNGWPSLCHICSSMVVALDVAFEIFLSLSVSVSLYLYLCLCVSVSVSNVPLSVSVSLSVSHCHCLCLSVCLSLSPFRAPYTHQQYRFTPQRHFPCPNPETFSVVETRR